MKTTIGSWMVAALVALPMAVLAKGDAVTCRAELDRGVLPAEKKATAVVRITLDAPAPEARERPPVNLCLVMDRSGSMSGQKIDKARSAALEAVRRLGNRDIVSLVAFDHEVDTLVPAQSAANSEWIEGRIRELTPRGNTAIYGGVSQGAAEIRKNAGDRYVSRMVLLSDGLANVGPAKPDDLGRLGASFRKEGISVTTVGVGTDFNEDLMTVLAERSDGNTYFVEDSRDLPRIFAAELGDVLSVVAREVKVTIECTGDVRPLRIIGREGVIHGNRVDVKMNQLYGGQQKFILLEVEIPATTHGRQRDLCMARVDYDNLVTKSRGETHTLAQATFSREEKDVTSSLNGAVQAQVLFNETAENREQAIKLSDEGKFEQAAQILSANAVGYEKLMAVTNDPELKRNWDKLQDEQQAVARGGYDNSGRKAARADAYQTKNQQLAK